VPSFWAWLRRQYPRYLPANRKPLVALTANDAAFRLSRANRSPLTLLTLTLEPTEGGLLTLDASLHDETGRGLAEWLERMLLLHFRLVREAEIQTRYDIIVTYVPLSLAVCSPGDFIQAPLPQHVDGPGIST
jgi:hypothetical protein